MHLYHIAFFHYNIKVKMPYHCFSFVADPLDLKYVRVGDSDHDEGVYATKKIAKGKTFCLYGGYVLSVEENKKLIESVNATVLEMTASKNYTEDEISTYYEETWMYKYDTMTIKGSFNLLKCVFTIHDFHRISVPLNCHRVIDIPPTLKPLQEYQSTIGHKINHSFKPNSQYLANDSPR